MSGKSAIQLTYCISGKLDDNKAKEVDESHRLAFLTGLDADYLKANESLIVGHSDQAKNKELFDDNVEARELVNRVRIENESLSKRNLDVEHAIMIIKEKFRQKVIEVDDLRQTLNDEVNQKTQLTEGFNQLFQEKQNLTKSLIEAKLMMNVLNK